VGEALLARDGTELPTWGDKNVQERDAEAELERQVSDVLRAMSVVWLPVGDAPGKDSRRAYIERNAIALLSRYQDPPTDEPSSGWLGNYSPREKIRAASLWNQKYVDDEIDDQFLDVFEELVRASSPA